MGHLGSLAGYATEVLGDNASDSPLIKWGYPLYKPLEIDGKS